MDFLTTISASPKTIGIAADHGGYELKEKMSVDLREAGYDVKGFRRL